MVTRININEKLVLLDLKVGSKFEAIEVMGKNLVDLDVVLPTFISATIEREKKYSTGLPGIDFAVAIPHTESAHVKEDAISIAVLHEPVSFNLMGTDNVELEIKMIFLLAIKNVEKQVKVLQHLMELFQKENALNQLKNSQTEGELIDLFNSHFNSDSHELN